MAAYQYADWRTQTDLTALIARLDLHIVEVSLLVTASVQANGSSRDAQTILEYYNSLVAQRDKYAMMPGATGVGTAGNRVRRIKFVR